MKLFDQLSLWSTWFLEYGDYFSLLSRTNFSNEFSEQISEQHLHHKRKIFIIVATARLSKILSTIMFGVPIITTRYHLFYKWSIVDSLQYICNRGKQGGFWRPLVSNRSGRMSTLLKSDPPYSQRLAACSVKLSSQTTKLAALCLLFSLCSVSQSIPLLQIAINFHRLLTFQLRQELFT